MKTKNNLMHGSGGALPAARITLRQGIRVIRDTG
jgi:hypothetical protein